MINLAVPVSPFPTIATNTAVFQMIRNRVDFQSGNAMMTQVIGDTELPVIEKITLVTEIQSAKPIMDSALVLKMIF